MIKIQSLMPLWGPYSKKYSGISRITEHAREKGVRFDLVVSPAVANTNTCPPNVTVPVGVHPWTAKADYSHYSYRCDLEWKDKIYADVSFTKLTDESILVRTALVNHSALPQNCLVNYFSALEFPSKYTTTVSLPRKCIFKKALDYVSYTYNTRRPWDEQTMDAMHKGEFFDDAFTEHRGLGDRDDNRYILQKFPKFGEEAGDSVSYTFCELSVFKNPVLTVRYQTTDEQDSAFAVNGKTVVFPATHDGLRLLQLPLPHTETVQLNFVSLGTGGVELDFLAITEQTETEQIVCETKKHTYLPQIHTELFNDGAKATYQYDGVEKPFAIRTFNKNTRFRNFPTGALEDSPTSRITQPDESFGNMLEQFSGSFSEKHSDDGFYHNAVAHTIFIAPEETKVEYAVITYGETDYQPLAAYEKAYLNAAEPLEQPAYTKAGEKYAFSNQLLRAAMFQNTVYPLYLHGDYVVHHTPGKRWDSFYTWDSGFIGLDMALYAPKIADAILDMYLSPEDNPDYAFLLHGSPVPVHIYQYYEMLNHTNDKSVLYGYYSRAKRFYDFLAGKINGSTTAKFKSGLTTTFDYFYNCSGMDDLPPQKAMYRENLQRVCAPAISSSQVIRTAKMLKTVAEHLGKTEDAAIFQADIDHLTAALQTWSWDEDCGYFSYVVHDRDGKPQEKLRTASGENLNKTMDGIYPLMAGAVTDTQKERILGHLKSETEMFTPVGISAVDRTAGYYLPNGYWNGNVWLSHQWFVWKTMLDLGETDFAYKIAETALNAWKREVEYSYYTFEMFSIETGRGGWFHNFGGLSAPINLWSAAYFTPGTYQSGFDTFCENAEFNRACTEFCGHFTNYGKCDAALLVVMAEKGTYCVTQNGMPAVFSARFDGMLEITLPQNAKNTEIRVQLV